MVLYRKKSYHSIVVPTVLATTARRRAAPLATVSAVATMASNGRVGLFNIAYCRSPRNSDCVSVHIWARGGTPGASLPARPWTANAGSGPVNIDGDRAEKRFGNGPTGLPACQRDRRFAGN